MCVVNVTVVVDIVGVYVCEETYQVMKKVGELRIVSVMDGWLRLNWLDESLMFQKK